MGRQLLDLCNHSGFHHLPLRKALLLFDLVLDRLQAFPQTLEFISLVLLQACLLLYFDLHVFKTFNPLVAILEVFLRDKVELLLKLLFYLANLLVD